MKSNSVSVLKVLVSGRTTAICSSLLVFGLLNCSGGDVDSGTKKGGNTGTGGATTSGGSTSNGGSNTTGGAKTTGGSNAGGAQNTGGSPAKGGSTTTPGSGGSTVIVGTMGGSPVVVGTGGVTTSGGSVALCSPQPVSKGGIACPAGICKVGTLGGYGFKYTDADGGKAGKSTICMMPDSLCAAGTTGAKVAPDYASWGAGIGFSLSPDTSGISKKDVQLTGTGISITIGNFASLAYGALALVNSGGKDYCANILTATTTLLWTDFKTECWGITGVALAGPPLTPDIRFQANAGAAAGNFDFCITALTIQ